MSTTTLGTTADRQSLLRRALLADGVVSGTMGVLLALAADPLNDLLDLPTLLLQLAGLSLLPYAAALIYLATRPTIHRRAAWCVIGLNLLWAAESLILLVAGWVDPTTLGIVFVTGQALVVVAFAELHYLGLRRSA